MISQIFTELTTSGGLFITFLKNLFQNVISIFYASATEGGAAALTDIGKLVLVGVATSFVFFVLRYISRLIKLRG